MAAAVKTLTKLGKDALVYGKENGAIVWKYAKVELRPPSPSDVGPAMKEGMKLLGQFKTGAWKQIPVKDAFIGSLVGIEVLCWFYIGECIGRRSLIGYKKVPGAWRLH